MADTATRRATTPHGGHDIIHRHTGWTCDAGVSLIAGATPPGSGRHAVIYVCPDHQGAAEERITATGYTPDTDPAPAGHRWTPWPCGHITARSTQTADNLTREPTP
jgi:hypothetical protein